MWRSAQYVKPEALKSKGGDDDDDDNWDTDPDFVVSRTLF